MENPNQRSSIDASSSQHQGRGPLAFPPESFLDELNFDELLDLFQADVEMSELVDSSFQDAPNLFEPSDQAQQFELLTGLSGDLPIFDSQINSQIQPNAASFELGDAWDRENPDPLFSTSYPQVIPESTLPSFQGDSWISGPPVSSKVGLIAGNGTSHVEPAVCVGFSPAVPPSPFSDAVPVTGVVAVPGPLSANTAYSEPQKSQEETASRVLLHLPQLSTDKPHGPVTMASQAANPLPDLQGDMECLGKVKNELEDTRVQTMIQRLTEDFSERQREREANAAIDSALEERLGIKIPNKNEVTEFCDKHGRKVLEESLRQIESEQEQGGVVSGLLLSGHRKSSAGKAAGALGVGGGRLQKDKARGKGRVRPKDHLDALEQHFEALKKEEAELREDIAKQERVVARMDNILNMKTYVMEESKLHLAQLDSQLQDIVMQQMQGSLAGLSIEERSKLTSIPAIFLGANPQDSQMVLSMLQTWKHLVERLSETLSQCTKEKAPGASTCEGCKSIELQINGLLRFIISSGPATGDAAFLGFLLRCHGLALAKNPDYVAEKYERVRQSISLSNSQLKKLFALNNIFASKTQELVKEKNELVQSMTGIELSHLSCIERFKEVHRFDEKLLNLRLINLSLREIRLLFNYTMLRRVLTPWQTGMCTIICYPQLPEPQFLACAILGMTDITQVSWQSYKDLMMAEVQQQS
uniref:Uncharacterized protein n=1 Tax=Tetraselmis sp. GSL018 TaxID=582737 RepID=A0A061S1T2_9CHLO|mmetsp:Transcript_32468/g.77061  ORF Transcript_32468/g.77061 Transcript_32468/m.77061 type:complete len:700 (-) Transcript_32468:83-2182(-)|eukprot:CAMPEP_0177608972 /NCGR_PEP_ID=MMETSP0419_2-20121207/18790_1 /TAXON_ID=582737 /ORGANISM="Tetraselmis sp., Strain GSL018" /LENGTH=699 /DNA_ID=CAMNT_0019103765 /DNA_START=57 /DNA_END=2156 /DNA_ORIENTATION=-